MPVNVFTSPGTIDTLQVDANITQTQRDSHVPTASLGQVAVSGTLSVSGTGTFASGLTASSISAGGLNSSFTSGLTASGGLQYDVISGSGNAPTTASSQSLSAASGVITMTSGLTSGTGPHTIYVSANTTTVSAVTLTPTSSASTSGIFQNGVEITVVNLAASGSRVQITAPGSLTVDTILISGGHSTRFVYNASAQTWIPLAL